jgi:DNA-binding transcriptional ArsR family regulator
MAPLTRSVAPVSPARAPVRSLGSNAALPVRFDVRTAYDFAMSLATDAGVEENEIPAEDAAWLKRARADLHATAGPAIDDDLAVFGAGLFIDRPEVTDAAAFVDLLRATPGKAFSDVVFSDSLRDPELRPDVDAALDGDKEALDRIVACWPAEKHGWVRKLLDDPEALVQSLTDRLSAWLPRYQEMEPRIQSIIERDVDLRSEDRATMGSVALIERTTNGIRWLSEPGVRRVVLAPSYLARPYNFRFSGGDWRMFVYPVSDAALEPNDPLAPPVGVLRLHRALGDDSRLRILRLLKDRDWYLTEIAERLELSKPTIKHHLAQLRAAGLVTLTEEGGLSYYSLRRDRLDDASAELKRFLA